jgi:hypothetical protein
MFKQDTGASTTEILSILTGISAQYSKPINDIHQNYDERNFSWYVLFKRMAFDDKQNLLQQGGLQKDKPPRYPITLCQ